MKLFYAATAIDDLRRLRGFVEQKNPAAAERIGSDLVIQIDKLRSAPRMGKPVKSAPDPDTIRDLVFGHYIARYSVHESTIVVLRVWHHLEDRQ